ncbi:signal transducing adapter molecule 1 [Hyalella azteca]|uniref:Signal transducing adapter molecule 1 n=1 Tax=Hyalella azteca TaxID=294128 RepID=A0A8B7P5M3_HYAAZ|nr:signal transducing adapter molecule 1 [Hyalella azteca]
MMGLFSAPANKLEPEIDRATSDANTSEDWALILDICDRVKEYNDGPKDCIKAIAKKLNSDRPRTALQAIVVLDACINNCGRNFHLEVASREFEQELRKIITNQRTNPKVSEKLRQHLLAWSEGDFKSDSQLSLIPELVSKLRQQGYEFSKPESPRKKVEYSNDPNVVNNKQEEDDIAQAIQLSLQTAPKSSTKTHSTSLYPSDLSSDLARSFDSSLTLSDTKGRTGNPPSTSTADAVKKARALYDFEAVEDNELTFHAGELVVVLDDSDPNWWKGSNHRGEGLFPGNFVTLDIHGDGEHQSPASRSEKRVSFSECVEVTEVEDAEGEPAGDEDAGKAPGAPPSGEIDEDKMDYLLHLLHEADSTGERPDDPQLPAIEEQVNAMAPTIDAELERIDRRHNELTRLNADLMAGLNLYHQLMREMPVSSMGYYPPPSVSSVYGPPMHHPMYPPQTIPGYPPYGMPGMSGTQPPHGMPPMSNAPHMPPPHAAPYGIMSMPQGMAPPQGPMMGGPLPPMTNGGGVHTSMPEGAETLNGHMPPHQLGAPPALYGQPPSGPPAAASNDTTSEASPSTAGGPMPPHVQYPGPEHLPHYPPYMASPHYPPMQTGPPAPPASAFQQPLL